MHHMVFMELVSLYKIQYTAYIKFDINVQNAIHSIYVIGVKELHLIRVQNVYLEYHINSRYNNTFGHNFTQVPGNKALYGELILVTLPSTKWNVCSLTSVSIVDDRQNCSH